MAKVGVNLGLLRRALFNACTLSSAHAEGKVVTWLKSVGDKVKKGEVSAAFRADG